MRRRGEELENGILEAAWRQLEEEGYERFSFDAVAQRAGTSKPVLYRRWSHREALLLALLQHQWQTQPVEVPDTGSLRGDILSLLRSASRLRRAMVAVMSVRLSAYYAETGKTPDLLRREVLGDRTTSMDIIVSRATDRGEIPPGLPQRVVTLPFDLFRHEAVMTLAEVPDAVIVEIVDVIFLPLVKSLTPGNM